MVARTWVGVTVGAACWLAALGCEQSVDEASPSTSDEVSDREAELVAAPSGQSGTAAPASIGTQFARAFPPKSVDAVMRTLEIGGWGCPGVVNPLKRTEEKCRCTENQRGFGIAKHQCTLSDHRAICQIRLQSHEGVLFQARAICHWDPRSGEAQQREIVDDYRATLEPKGFVRNGDRFDYELLDAHVRRTAEARLAEILGPQLEAPVPEALAASYELLTSLDHGLVLGTRCAGPSGKGPPPVGYQAMEELVARGRADLLRNSLRGMNPAGRYYGYVGLARLGEVTASDERVRALLGQQNVRIQTCRGCIQHAVWAPALDLNQYF